jgi:hypothetical protein
MLMRSLMLLSAAAPVSRSAMAACAAKIRLRGAEPVQLRAQEIDEAVKIRVVVQRDPLGVHSGSGFGAREAQSR